MGGEQRSARATPLPASLTRFVSDPGARIPADRFERPRTGRAAGRSPDFRTAVIAVAVFVSAGGHILRAW